MRFYLGALSLLLLTACNENVKKTTPASESKPALETNLYDEATSPCDDFFQYTNGKWVEENPIPETESRWGNFNILVEENQKNIKSLLLSTIEHPTTHNEQLMANLYHSAMDSDQIEKNGIQDILPFMEKVDQCTDKQAIMELAGEWQAYDAGAFFSFWIDSDEKDSKTNIVKIYQSGLGLPGRDYYLRDDEQSLELQSAYRDHIDHTLKLAQQKDASDAGDRVYAIEKAFAEHALTRAENRIAEKTYNKMTLADYQELSPSIDWKKVFDKMGVASFNNMIIKQPAFVKGVDGVIASTSLEDLKTYLKWHFLSSVSSYLTNDFQQADFGFYSTKMRGTKKMKPRWKRALNTINGNIGETLGQIYVKHHFTAESKERVGQMVENIKEVFRQRLNDVDWMSAETKERAIQKLNTFNKKIGYPDVWKDYSELELGTTSYVNNVLACRSHEFKHNVSKLGAPVDKDEWHMSPQTVNAYYDASRNEIVFPAAILQPPFFNPDADDAVNYGAIGAVIGHEFSHGFDDQGSKYDHEGNFNNWWTEDDRKKFDERTQLIIDQFDAFEPLKDVFVDGRLTLGENIADLGGITLAYHALLKEKEGKEDELIEGFDHKQRFFLGYAQLWRGHMTDAEKIRRIKTDPHSPPQYRVAAPLTNLNEFQHAFGCSHGDAMVRPDSIKPNIW